MLAEEMGCKEMSGKEMTNKAEANEQHTPGTDLLTRNNSSPTCFSNQIQQSSFVELPKDADVDITPDGTIVIPQEDVQALIPEGRSMRLI